MEYLDYTKTTFDSKMGKDGAVIVTLEQGNKMTLVLTQSPYVTGTLDNTYYTANAFDLLDESDEDKEYRIEWKIRTNYMDEYLEAHGEEDEDERKSYFSFLSELFGDDEENMCDWDNPSYIAQL